MPRLKRTEPAWVHVSDCAKEKRGCCGKCLRVDRVAVSRHCARPTRTWLGTVDCREIYRWRLEAIPTR
eukprot:3289715-Prymnesium_polylepis.1